MYQATKNLSKFSIFFNDFLKESTQNEIKKKKLDAENIKNFFKSFSQTKINSIDYFDKSDSTINVFFCLFSRN